MSGELNTPSFHPHSSLLPAGLCHLTLQESSAAGVVLSFFFFFIIFLWWWPLTNSQGWRRYFGVCPAWRQLCQPGWVKARVAGAGGPMTGGIMFFHADRNPFMKLYCAPRPDDSLKMFLYICNTQYTMDLTRIAATFPSCVGTEKQQTQPVGFCPLPMSLFLLNKQIQKVLARS